MPLEEVVPVMCAFDVASLPQSMDGVGMFRYTTKIAEELALRLPELPTKCRWLTSSAQIGCGGSQEAAPWVKSSSTPSEVV